MVDLEALIEAAVERGVRRALEELKPAEEAAELLTPQEAAKAAKVSEDTVRRWVDAGLLGRYGSPRKLRVRRDELLRVRPPRSERTSDDVVTDLLGRR